MSPVNLKESIRHGVRLATPGILTLTLLAVGAPASANPVTGSIPTGQSATQVLSTLTVADKSGSTSDRKTHQWNKVDGKASGYTTRDLVLERDMTDVTFNSKGNVSTGILLEPYTGTTIHFQRGESNKTEGGSASNRDGGIQIDHVVAYAEAYRSGLENLTYEQRDAYYNDPDVLLSSQAGANNEKKDGTAAEWLPSSQSFRCDYASLQIGIKAKYGLTIDQAEHDSLAEVLTSCPSETIISTSEVKQRLADGVSDDIGDDASSAGTGDGESEPQGSGSAVRDRVSSWVRKRLGGLLGRLF